jgi:signal transduction histidine kinase
MNKKTYSPSTVSQISHELRIPLTGILGMLRFLKDTPLTSQQQQYLEIIQQAANNLLLLENKLHVTLKKYA